MDPLKPNQSYCVVCGGGIKAHYENPGRACYEQGRADGYAAGRASLANEPIKKDSHLGRTIDRLELAARREQMEADCAALIKYGYRETDDPITCIRAAFASTQEKP